MYEVMLSAYWLLMRKSKDVCHLYEVRKFNPFCHLYVYFHCVWEVLLRIYMFRFVCLLEDTTLVCDSHCIKIRDLRQKSCKELCESEKDMVRSIKVLI